jgi:transcription-repair coupling factor (superfamily II helicase)
MYCDLLEKTVRRMKNLAPKVQIDVNLTLPGEAYLPRRYVPDMRLKIDLYRRLARVTTDGELADLRAELLDRFGALPIEVERLLLRVEIAILAARWSINAIHLEDQHIVFGYTLRPQAEKLIAARRGQLRIVDGKSIYGTMSSATPEPDALLALIRKLLSDEPSSPRPKLKRPQHDHENFTRRR